MYGGAGNETVKKKNKYLNYNMETKHRPEAVDC